MEKLQDKTEHTTVQVTLSDGSAIVDILDTVKGRPALNSLDVSDVLRVLLTSNVTAKIYEKEYNSIYTRFKRTKKHIQKLRSLGFGYNVDQYHNWLTEQNQKSQIKRGVKPKEAKKVLKCFAEPEIQDAFLHIDRISKRKIEETEIKGDVCLIKAIADSNATDGIDLAACDVLNRFGSVTIPLAKYKRVQCDWITKYKDKDHPKKFLRLEIPNKPEMVRIALIDREQYQFMQGLAGLASVNPSEETIARYMQLQMDQMPVRVPLAYDRNGKPDFEKTNELIEAHRKFQPTD